MIARARFYASLLSPRVARGYLSVPRATVPSRAESLRQAIDWICRAQDAAGDGGVARCFLLAYNTYFQRQGWMPSYPETTGYIIPTFFEYARLSGNRDVFARAVKMADWECSVQMPNGAVMGGTIDAVPAPAVFNTGQVIFGWVSAFEETGDERYLIAARRAGDFLRGVQDADGAWRKALGAFASRSMPSYTYNTRTAWAMQLLADASGREEYRDAATRNIDFALTQQQSNGWLRDNCLSDATRPLLHTIAYSLRGILEVGILVDDPRYIAAARLGADALIARQRPDGRLAGRYDARWEPAVEYSCLTGNVQMGTVWGRLFEVTGERTYLEAVSRANRFTQSVQWQGSGDPNLDGGVAGSFPLHGNYGRFELLNWAAKFFADSLMLEDRLTKHGAAPDARHAVRAHG